MLGPRPGSESANRQHPLTSRDSVLETLGWELAENLIPADTRCVGAACRRLRTGDTPAPLVLGDERIRTYEGEAGQGWGPAALVAELHLDCFLVAGIPVQTHPSFLPPTGRAIVDAKRQSASMCYFCSTLTP